MTPYRPLPQPPRLEPDQPVVQRGLAILAFVMEHGCTATVTDLDLASADHAGIVASSGKGFDSRTYDRISCARTLISVALHARHALLTDVSVRMASGVTPHTPDLGPMATLRVPPVTRPPSGDYAEIDEHRVIDRVQF